VSKNDTARILQEIAELNEDDRKKILKGVKKMMRENAAPIDTPTP
jgi:transcription initiation factor TFIIIB Brf1 subunit/transcription initiation factor TFIIB